MQKPATPEPNPRGHQQTQPNPSQRHGRARRKNNNQNPELLKRPDACQAGRHHGSPELSRHAGVASDGPQGGASFSADVLRGFANEPPPLLRARRQPFFSTRACMQPSIEQVSDSIRHAKDTAYALLC